VIASLAVAAVLAACPPAGPVAPVADPAAPPDDALIACVGVTAVSGQRFSHWLAVSQKGSPGAPAAQLHRQVTEFLLSGLWLEGEAAERGIKVSERTVRRVFTRQKHAAFRTEAEFRHFLADSGLTRSDIKYRVRLDILSDRVRKDVIGSGTRAAKQRRFDRFVRRFHAKWKARTLCQPNYPADQCGGTFAG
jgi:hypothetical protein